MDENQLVVGCVVILLLSFNISQSQANCKYKYYRQPAKPKNDCNLESSVPLVLTCRVYSNVNDSFTIQWHYSNSSSRPSLVNSTSMETIINESNIMININESDITANVKESTLTLTNYSNSAEMVSGYYWCTVRSGSGTLSNPSQVVDISIILLCPNEVEGHAQDIDNCEMQVDLFEMMTECADEAEDMNLYVEKVQLGLCAPKGLVTNPTSIYTDEPTSTREVFPTLDQSTVSPSRMNYVWMIVGIAFGILIVIIVIMFIAIIYLNHKKNKIKVSSMTRTHVHNPYIESTSPQESPTRETLVGATTAEQEEIRAEAGYEIPINVIHVHNANFGGDHSPDSKTSSSGSALHSPPGDYEDVSTVKQTRDSIKRHQYEMVESGEQSEYSHLQHAHGGSRKFSTNSTGTAPPPSMSQNRSTTSSLSLSGHHQPEPVFNSPEYMTIELNGSKSTKIQPETGEGVINADTGYSHINHKVLKTRETTTREADLGPDLDSEGYHLLPSVFTGVEPNRDNSSEQRQSSHTKHTHPQAHRHKSATLASQPYTPIESTNVMKRNAYSFTIVSTDEEYVSERGHVYHLLERSDVHQQNQSIPNSSDSEGTAKFCIQEDGDASDGIKSSSIPPYSQVNKSSKQESDNQKDIEESEEQNDSSSLQESSPESSRKVLPPYSQVDKSKKKNRQPQAQLDTQLNPETHHYHILEQSSEDKTEKLSGEKGGPIYHIIDHEP